MTGRIRRYGTEARPKRTQVKQRRCRDHGVVSAAIAGTSGSGLLDIESGSRFVPAYAPFRTRVMLSLAFCAACFTDSLPCRIVASMLRRILPFSTSTQCLAAGTNQLRTAARSFTLVPRRLVAL